jgi:hypothetical protein
MNGLPNTVAMMVFTDTAMTTLFVASHGRGMWMMQIPQDTNPTPTVTSVALTSGATTGGNTVTIKGTNFLATPTVYFDLTAAPTVSVVNSTTLTVVTPAHGAGVVAITVVNPDNRGAVLPAAFTYGVVAPLPPSQPAGTLNGSPGPLPGGRPPTGPIDPNTPPPLPGRRP